VFLTGFKCKNKIGGFLGWWEVWGGGGGG